MSPPLRSRASLSAARNRPRSAAPDSGVRQRGLPLDEPTIIVEDVEVDLSDELTDDVARDHEVARAPLEWPGTEVTAPYSELPAGLLAACRQAAARAPRRGVPPPVRRAAPAADAPREPTPAEPSCAPAVRDDDSNEATRVLHDRKRVAASDSMRAPILLGSLALAILTLAVAVWIRIVGAL
jgi:hypothetical protein